MGEVVQVRGLGVVEVEGAGEGVEDAVRDAGQVAAFKAAGIPLAELTLEIPGLVQHALGVKA